MEFSAQDGYVELELSRVRDTDQLRVEPPVAKLAMSGVAELGLPADELARMKWEVQASA